jgi:hypothetical protein
MVWKEPQGERANIWYKAPPGDAPRIIWNHLVNLGQWRSLFLQKRAAYQWLLERESWVPRAGTYLEQGALESAPTSFGHRLGMADHANGPSLNAYASTIRYGASRMFEEIPGVEIAPNNANHEAAQRAKLYTAALEFAMTSESGKAALRATGILGLNGGWGAWLPEVVAGHLRISRLRFEDCWWDPRDARDGDPQSLHVARRWTRSKLIAHVKSLKIPQVANNIDRIVTTLREMPEAPVYGPQNQTAQGIEWTDPYDRHLAHVGLLDQSDHLWVVQSWHLPGSKDSPVYDGKWNRANEKILCEDAGRMMITVHGGQADAASMDSDHATLCLFDGPHRRLTFPVAWWSPIPHDKGIDGSGLGALAEPYQRQIDTVWQRFDDLITNWGDTICLIDSRMKDQKENIAAVGGVTFVEVPNGVLGAGKGYEFVPASPLSPQQIDYISSLIAQMSERLWLNPAGQSGQTTLGANAAGIALVEEEGKQDQAMSHLYWNWVSGVVRCAEEIINALSDASANDKSFKVPYEDATGAHKSLRWLDPSDELGDYSLQAETVGMLGRTKSGRIQKLVELGRYGAVPPQTAVDAIRRSPDIKRVLRDVNAPADLVEWQLDGLAVVGKDAQFYAQFNPDNNTPHELGIERAIARLQIATQQGVEDETRIRYDSYIMSCRDLMRKQQATIQAEMAPPAGDVATTGGEVMPVGPEMPTTPGIEPAGAPQVPDLPPLPI